MTDPRRASAKRIDVGLMDGKIALADGRASAKKAAIRRARGIAERIPFSAADPLSARNIQTAIVSVGRAAARSSLSRGEHFRAEDTAADGEIDPAPAPRARESAGACAAPARIAARATQPAPRAIASRPNRARSPTVRVIFSSDDPAPRACETVRYRGNSRCSHPDRPSARRFSSTSS